jgi:hypothetical protein
MFCFTKTEARRVRIRDTIGESQVLSWAFEQNWLSATVGIAKSASVSSIDRVRPCHTK